MKDIAIISPTAYEVGHYEAVCRLMGQLTTRSIVFTAEDYARMVQSPCSRLFLLLCEGRVGGMLTVGTYLSPTGSKAWIEDVVVDEALRGSGLGRVLVEHAIDYCREEGIGTVYLTSNPKRVAANALYRSVGFVRKETNMYKMELTE